MTNEQNRITKSILGVIILLTAAGISNVKAQAVADFGGTWNTVTSKGKKIVLTLQMVRRAEVSGTYGRNAMTGSYPQALDDDLAFAFVKVSANGTGPMVQSASTIRGRIVDNVLRFRWQEDGGHGAGKFTLSADGQSFTGTFSLTDLPDDTSGGTWNGTRAPNFLGVWQTKVGGQIQFPELLLQQTGLSVVGRLFANRPDVGIIREGIVDGNTVRFKIYRQRTNLPPGVIIPDDLIGTGELVMDPGSKSFKGTIMGSPTSGTLIGR